MPDLRDGETRDVWGSAAKPYRMKNVDGVYSCSCPAWRNQSLPINQRTCKRLRQMRGEDAEIARVGTGDATMSSGRTRRATTSLPLLLAQTWSEELDPSGYWLSEKLDGVRAYFDGSHFYSRNGNRFDAPEWFRRGLPTVPLDGELWIGRKQFQRTVSIVRRNGAAELWTGVRYVIFDAPTLLQPFEERIQTVKELIQTRRPPFAQVLSHLVCQDREHLSEELMRVETLGGEGLMMRQPHSLYVRGRSDTLLKVKTFQDCEAVVVGHESGHGRHRGRLGALTVELTSGVRCQVGTGFTDAQRERPPRIGTVVKLKYQELTDDGVPRFPVFAGLRPDVSLLPASAVKGNLRMTNPTIGKASSRRRFEFVQGNSSKFWQISVLEGVVAVEYGRIGTVGQAQHESFPDAVGAAKRAEKAIREKLAKGYVEAA